ncbi:MAG: aldo/keto reductase [Phycisphaerales bacterium]|nr:aldo/keto reductase [Phycisphaerales bacterium]
MEQRPLGNTGLMVSPIGLGTVKLGRNRGVKYPGGEGFALPSDDQATELLHIASELGVNLIDTAPAYGESERRLGELMKRSAWFGGRDRWVICTKVGEEFDSQSAASTYDFSAMAVKASVERSMRRLGVDVLDVVLVHSDGRDEWILESSGAMDALRELRRRGLVRAIGLSAKGVDGGLASVRKSEGACDVVMLTYNARERAEGVVIDAARPRGVGVLVKKGLLSGHIDEVMSRMPPEIKAQTDDPVEASMRLVLGRRGVHSMIVGTSSAAHLADNVRAAELAIGI